MSSPHLCSRITATHCSGSFFFVQSFSSATTSRKANYAPSTLLPCSSTSPTSSFAPSTHPSLTFLCTILSPFILIPSFSSLSQICPLVSPTRYVVDFANLRYKWHDISAGGEAAATKLPYVFVPISKPLWCVVISQTSILRARVLVCFFR